MHISRDRWPCFLQKTCRASSCNHMQSQTRTQAPPLHATWPQTSYPLSPLSSLLQPGRIMGTRVEREHMRAEKGREGRGRENNNY